MKVLVKELTTIKLYVCVIPVAQLLTYFISGISSVWLERVIWDHEAASSSLASRTIVINSVRNKIKTIHIQEETKR